MAVSIGTQPVGRLSIFSNMLQSMFAKMRSGFQSLISEARADSRKFILDKLSKTGGYIVITLLNFGVSSGLTAFTAFLCWLIYFHPYSLHPQVDSAVLVTFDLTSHDPQALLHYDLRLNMTFHNKRGLSNIHFDHLTAGLYYNGTKIGPSDDTLPSFKLEPEQRRIVQLVLCGRASRATSAAVADPFARERGQGQFNLDVRLKTTLRYRFFPHKGTYFYEYDCWLQFPPVPGNGTPAFTGGFKCGVAK